MYSPLILIALFCSAHKLLNTLWEQFAVAVHDRSHLSNAKKLAYFKHSIKEGASSRGLSKSGDQYDEAIKCLKDQSNRPKLIHEAIIHRIIGIATLKEGNSRSYVHSTIQLNDIFALSSVWVTNPVRHSSPPCYS